MSAPDVPAHLAKQSPFDWARLAGYKLGGVWPAGYPTSVLTFWSGRDDVSGVLAALIGSATHSLVISMFGYDDAELDAIIRAKMEDEHVFVQMSLDRTQAGGVHEKRLLSNWNPADITNSVAIGTSPHGAILHLKMVIVDALYVVHGSTNFSLAGETLQANEATITADAALASEARSVLDIQHQHILAQQGARPKAIPA